MQHTTVFVEIDFERYRRERVRYARIVSLLHILGAKLIFTLDSRLIARLLSRLSLGMFRTLCAKASEEEQETRISSGNSAMPLMNAYVLTALYTRSLITKSPKYLSSISHTHTKQYIR